MAPRKNTPVASTTTDASTPAAPKAKGGSKRKLETTDVKVEEPVPAAAVVEKKRRKAPVPEPVPVVVDAVSVPEPTPPSLSDELRAVVGGITQCGSTMVDAWNSMRVKCKLFDKLYLRYEKVREKEKKKKSSKKSGQTGQIGGFVTNAMMSPEMAEFLGKEPDQLVSRKDAFKQIHAYIKDNGLQGVPNPKGKNDRRIITPDGPLTKVFGPETVKTAQENYELNKEKLGKLAFKENLNYFKLQHILAPHFVSVKKPKAVAVADAVAAAE